MKNPIKAIWVDKFAGYNYCEFVISRKDRKAFLLYNFFYNDFDVDIEIYKFENSFFISS